MDLRGKNVQRMSLKVIEYELGRAEFCFALWLLFRCMWEGVLGITFFSNSNLVLYYLFSVPHQRFFFLFLYTLKFCALLFTKCLLSQTCHITHSHFDIPIPHHPLHLASSPN